jgi:hypothetical protein
MELDLKELKVETENAQEQYENISSILISLFLCPNEAKKLSANFSETALLFLLISASLTPNRRQ